MDADQRAQPQRTLRARPLQQRAGPLLGYTHMKTERLPVEIRYFSQRGFRSERARRTCSRAANSKPEPPSHRSTLRRSTHGEDRFWVLDAFVGYRLPNRRGLLSLNADNLLDEDFQFQDIDPTNPSLFPERIVSFRFTLAFE